MLSESSGRSPTRQNPAGVVGVADPRQLVEDARRGGYAVGAFNMHNDETTQALLQAAERAQAPVFLQVGRAIIPHMGLRKAYEMTRRNAAESSARYVVHLDHGSYEEVIEAIRLGFDSVMYDGSHLDFAANVAATRELAARCHAAGVAIEAELGEVGGKDGVHAPGARTDPADAARFVEDTGVDALAVAVGSSHAMTERTARLDEDLVAAISAQVPVPLVLHGSSGVPDDGLVGAVRAGMTKINIATHLNSVFTQAMSAPRCSKAACTAVRSL